MRKALLASMLATVVGAPGLAQTQVNCDAIPPGPARTDCYIGLARSHGQQSEIAAGVAQQQGDAAIYRRVTGTRARKPVRSPQ